MKKLILSELLLLFLATTFMTDSLPVGWYQQTLPVNNFINDIKFIDSLNGWAVTQASTSDSLGYILNTTDGGTNWTINFADKYNFNVIQFLDLNNGYCFAKTNSIYLTILKTTNSGVNWQIFNNIAGIDAADLFFVNKDTGWVTDPSGVFGGLYKTTNGGLNWFQQMSGNNFPKKLFFINKDTGWAISSDNRIYRTVNSGTNWLMQHFFSNQSLVDVFFTSRDTGWIHGGSTGLFKTTDSGFNWDTVSTPFGYGNGNIYFTDSKHGWIGRSFSRILVTSNGSTWGYQNTPTGNHYAVYFTDTLKGWAGGDNLIHTTDGGGPITYIGIKSSSAFVTSFDLKQNYPNPFNPSTTIDFEVKKPSRITLKLYSVDGREVDELLDYERFPAGSYYVDFDADNDLASGVYLYQMTGWTEDKQEIFIDTKKMVLIK